MNSSTTPPSHTAAVDEDLARQARPGHGIPSQDPDPAAQLALEPEEAKREAESVMTGGGVVGGAAIGASIGVAVAGPVGVVVGGTLGAVAGAVGAAAAGAMMRPDDASVANPATGDTVPAQGSKDPANGGAKP
jgi:non-heme chloroperoxidase